MAEFNAVPKVFDKYARTTTKMCQGPVADYKECVTCANTGCKDCTLVVQLINKKASGALEPSGSSLDAEVKKVLTNRDKLVIRLIKKKQEGFHVDVMAKVEVKTTVDGKTKVEVKSKAYDIAYLYKRLPHAAVADPTAHAAHPAIPHSTPVTVSAHTIPVQVTPPHASTTHTTTPAHATTPAIAHPAQARPGLAHQESAQAPAHTSQALPLSYFPEEHGMNGDTASKQSWQLAKTWLAACERNHKCAASSPEHSVLPTRVLDLHPPQNECAQGIRLHVSGTGEKGVYTCLSHRWGESQPLKTENETLDERKAGIEERDLPKTFKDAVEMTRYLGIRYLWIDSLCIVQNNSEDWNNEASKMADIYQNARITLAATVSNGAESGLFHHNNAAADKELSAVTGNHDHAGIFIINPARNQYHGLQGNPELLQRGWVMQERFLSARLLHFAHELVWECRQSRVCECSGSTSTLWPETLAYKRNCDETNLKKMSAQALYAQWYFVVAHYSTLTIKYDADILPALSGMAKVFYEYIKGGVIAGLWKNHLFSELTWMVRAPKTSKRRLPGEGLNFSAVPTFSWTSVRLEPPTAEDMKDYPMQFRTKGGPNEDWGLRWINRERVSSSTYKDKEYKCEIMSFDCELQSSDLRGKINKAEIVLKGYLYPTTIKGLRQLTSACEPRLAAEEKNAFYPDFDFLHASNSHHGLAIGTQLFCFMLQSYEGRPVSQGEDGEDVKKRVEELARHGGPPVVKPVDGRTAAFDATRDASWALSLVLKRVKDCVGHGEFERVGIMEFQGGPVRGNMAVGRTKTVPWSEEIRKKAGINGAVVVRDAVVKIT